MRPPRPILLAACLVAGAATGPAAAQAPAIVGEWTVAAIGDEAVSADQGLTVAFAVDGTVSGSTGCNAFSGTYEARGAGLTMGPFRITRRSCPDEVMRREAAMMRVLGTARRIDPRVEGRLAITDGGSGAALLLARPSR
jgi:heat shock protein HslJ